MATCNREFFWLVCMCQLVPMTVLVGITVFDFDFRFTIGPAAQTLLKPNQELSRVSGDARNLSKCMNRPTEGNGYNVPMHMKSILHGCQLLQVLCDTLVIATY